MKWNLGQWTLDRDRMDFGASLLIMRVLNQVVQHARFALAFTS